MTELKNENRSSDWWMPIFKSLKKTEVESKVHKNETDLIQHPKYQVWYRLIFNHQTPVLNKIKGGTKEIHSVICTVYSSDDISTSDAYSFDLYFHSIEDCIERSVRYFILAEKTKHDRQNSK